MAAGSSGRPAGAAQPITSQVLPNGITVVSRQRPGSQVVAIDVAVRAGARYETTSTASAARFLESALLLGTDRWPSRDELLRAISGRGGQLSVDAGREILETSVTVGLPDLDIALDVIDEILLHSRFDGDALERERNVIIRQIQERDDEPDDHASDMLFETVFAGHPLGHRPTGTRVGVQALTVEQLRAYWTTRLVGPNVIIGVISGLPDASIAERLGAALADVPSGPVPALNYADLPAAVPREIGLDAGTDQAHVFVAVPLPGVMHEDRAALRVMNAILSRSSGRLFTEIRDRRGLVYSTYSTVPQFADGGAFIVYGGTDPATSDEVVEAIKTELARMVTTPVGNAELQNAIEGAIGSETVANEASSSEVTTLTRNTVFGIPPREIQAAQLRAVTPGDVQRVAQRYFDAGRMTVVVARPEPDETEEPQP